MKRTGNNILFDEEKIGPDGSNFTLYPSRGIEGWLQIRKAKKWLKRYHKVINITVQRIG